MADILLRLDGSSHGCPCRNPTVEQICKSSNCDCWIYGNDGTFCIVRDYEDTIASIGYVCQPNGQSVKETLSAILTSFDETLIGELKKGLIGQFVLLVKKKQKIYVFSDFMGARNIFYSDDGRVISTSFSKMEDSFQRESSNLDRYKILEFLAMRHILYPAWLGISTFHKRIKWLLPNDYLVIDVQKGILRHESIVYSLNNMKEANVFLLSRELNSTLTAIVSRPEFKNSRVAASLSGGRDSRLVAAIAAGYYNKIHYRIAIAPGHIDSLKDMEVAKKLARIREVPLDVYEFQPGSDEERFRELTEGFSPTYNNKITAVIDNVGSYSIGFGGVFGTELFMPIPWTSIDIFVQNKVENAKRALKVEDNFWDFFRESLYEQFQWIKDHFLLSTRDDRDYIRLFITLDTARYASFILAAFNSLGYQLEPYGSYAVLDLALRVSPDLWGNHRRFGGDALVQIASMSEINPRMARVLTYKNFRPMLPLSSTSLPLYAMGATLQAFDWLKRKSNRKLDDSTRTHLLDAHYLSDGWESQFLDRTVEKYGFPVKRL